MNALTMNNEAGTAALASESTMKAVTFKRYGDYRQLALQEVVERPEPAADEVLIQVSVSSVNRGDWHYVHGAPLPLRFMAGGLCSPKRNIPGVDAVGLVVKVGADVSDYKTGDRVLADLSNSGFGGWAEYTTCKAIHVAPCPQQLAGELAATIPISAVTALQGLRDHARLRAGESVLINGASGGVGMYVALIAAKMGAVVTVVGHSGKAEFLQQLGAHDIIFYDHNDFLQSAKQYDVIVDAAAYRPFYQMSGALTASGRYLMIGGSMSQFARIALLGRLFSRKMGRKYLSYLQSASSDDMQTIANWIVKGDIEVPAPRLFQMDEASLAMQSMEQRQLAGKVCLQIT